MRKKYRNELFHLITELGFNPDEFDLIEDTEKEFPTTTISYKNTPLKFIIRNSPENYEYFDYQYTPYGPGYVLTDFEPLNDFTDFNTTYSVLKGWLKYTIKGYNEDAQEPDLWSEFKKGNKTLNINQIDFNDKSTFSLDEKKQILMAINELKSLIHKNLQTTQEQQNLVIDRLNYLIEASERLNKFDWKSLAISTLMSITIALSLDTQKGQVLFDLFTKVFSVLPMLVQNQ